MDKSEIALRFVFNPYKLDKKYRTTYILTKLKTL